MTIDIDRMTAELVFDEGRRLKVYDDANGLPITKNSHVLGHPTIGVGRALDTNGITEIESNRMLADDITLYINQMSAIPWFRAMDPVRQRVVLNMRHQMGYAGVLAFHQMIDAIGAGNYLRASEVMLNSTWARVQSPARARRLSQMMASGADPKNYGAPVA